MMVSIEAGIGYNLHEACKLNKDMVDYCHKVLQSGDTNWRTAMKTSKCAINWQTLLNKRIRISYDLLNTDLVWLDDKVEQISTTAALCKKQLHLPVYAHAATGDADAHAALCSVVQEKVALNEAIVVKPRHGSNTKHVALWPTPQDAGVEAVLKSVRKALNSEDRTWKKESWNQNAVQHGAVLQPMYAPISTLVDCGDMLDPMHRRPLELKVQVLFGEVVGANLNTYTASHVWVSREGGIHLWDSLAHAFLKRHHGNFDPLPKGVLKALQQAVRRDWLAICADSELIARTSGLDELRVDWLLGDKHWGPRIGETTYMGTFALDMLPASVLLARAYATAHLSRLGLAIEAFNRPVILGLNAV